MEIEYKNINTKTDIIFIIGNSASGKSTIAEKLSKKLKYELINFDLLINKLAKNHPDGMKITKMYKPNKYMNEKNIIINQIKDIIHNKKKVIIEGTIWDPYIIKKIKNKKPYQLIFIQPKTKRKYYFRILKRVKSGTMSIVKKILTNNELKNENKVKEFIKNLVNIRFNEFNEAIHIFNEFDLKILYL